MTAATGKMQLSRSILDMKFMKKTKEKVEQQLLQEEGEEFFENQLTTKMKKDSSKYTIEHSYIFCEKLIEGRLSFQGMNPEIERIMELEYNEKNVKNEQQRETEISDEQLAKHLISSQAKRIERRFKPKRSQHTYFSSHNSDDEPLEKKPKFLKPID